MEFLKSIGGKIVTGLVGLVVIACAISWWRAAPSTRDAILSGAAHLGQWLLIVLLVPWATFFIIGWVAKFEANWTGGVLVFVYTALEMLLLLWLFGWSVHGASAWTFVALGTLVAAVYNLFTCDWLAEKVS